MKDKLNLGRDYSDNSTREIMFDKKQMRVIFLFEFKMGHKTVEATHNINNTIGPGTTKEQIVQRWIKKFWKGDKALEDEKHHGWLLELILLQLTTQEVARQLNINFPIFIWHLNQIGKVKKLYMWVPHELTTDQKQVIVLKFYKTTSKHQLSGWTHKKLQNTSQNQTCTRKKAMATVWWSAASLIHCSFLNPGKTITSERYAQQIYEIHRKLMGPVFLHDNDWPYIAQPLFLKLNELGYEVLSHLPYSPDLLFFQEKCFHKTETENAFQEELNKLISHWQKCADCNDSYFD
ncbi:hypothetical protein FD755_023420 [Muntiacus reevesi]|uniref:Mos1 transposase HTH domain-containing protein n=1 Tax=Muntiacus reevesi TaxID=9886 RepID=A0A5N3VXC8_MUNRE|nr:hypothetical protein FD755_023420 [Muntiacus reevesi]